MPTRWFLELINCLDAWNNACIDACDVADTKHKLAGLFAELTATATREDQ